METNLTASANKPKTKILPLHVYFKKNIRRFLKETSLNGLKYIEDVHRNLWERGYYLISFAIVFTAGLYMAFYFLQKWQSTPVIVGMSSKATSIKDVPFPAITFCNMNQALSSKVKNIKLNTPEYAMLQRICFQKHNYTQYKNFKPRFKDDNFINFKLKNSQKCSDMIIYCKFGPVIEPCTNLFREIVLDEGICCVFNQLHPFFIHKQSYMFIRDYTSLNRRTSIPVNWNLETGYETPLPKSYYPRKAPGSGVSMGLTVVLNADIDDYYCSSTNGAGFKVLLYNPVDSPDIKETGLPIMLGHQTRILINTKLIESQPSLRSIKPQDRQCYFSTEKPLLAYKYYTRRHCEAECDARQMLNHCNCIPYYMKKIYANASICFLGDMDCVEKAERLLTDPLNLKCKQRCLPGCHDLAYYPDMFATPLAKRNFNLQNPFFHNISKETMHKNLAMLQIFYKDNTFRGSTRVPYTGFTEFLSQTGGVMSLMVGFSVNSVAEIFYFVLLKSFIDIFMKRNPAVLESRDDEIKHDNSANDQFHHQVLFKGRRRINNRNRITNWNKNDINYHHEKY